MTDIRALRETVREHGTKLQSLYDAAEAASWSAEADAAYQAQAVIHDKALSDLKRMEEHQTRMRGTKAVAGKEGNPDDEKKFGAWQEQLAAVMRADQKSGSVFDERLMAVAANGQILGAATGLNESLGPDGGYLVQKDFVGPLMTNVWDNSEILNRIRKLSVGANSNGIVMNGIDETSRANGQRWGGVMAYWLAEAGLKIPSRTRYKRIEMQLQKLAILMYATDELLQDTDALSAWMSMAAEDEFNFRIEDAIINGAGAGLPLGLLFSDATIVVAASAGTPVAGITPVDIANMWSRLPPTSRGNAVWLISPDLEIKLNFFANIITNRAGTENVAAVPGTILYTPPGTNGNQFGTLMGRPVIPTEYNAAAGTVGDIILADLSQYLGIDKGDIQQQSSMHVRFIYDETCFRFVYRFNGQPMWTQPVTPKNGTVLRSPFVTLAAR